MKFSDILNMNLCTMKLKSSYLKVAMLKMRFQSRTKCPVRAATDDFLLFLIETTLLLSTIIILPSSCKPEIR